MARSDYGTIEVELMENTYELKPTLRALQRINQQYGSIREAVQHVQQLDIDALIFVVAEGAGIRQQKDRQELAEEIFETGIMEVFTPVNEYVNALLNPTGKSSDEDDDEGKASRRSRRRSRSTNSSDKEQDG